MEASRGDIDVGGGAPEKFKGAVGNHGGFMVNGE